MRAIILSILALSVFATAALAQPSRPDRGTKIAQVNGATITLGEVDDVLRSRPTSLTVPTAVQVRQARLDIVTTMVDDMLLRQFMREQGPKVDATIIDKQVIALTDGLKPQNRTLEDYCKGLNLSEKQLRENMLMLLQLDQYVKDHTTEADMKNYFEANRAYFDKTTVRVSHIVIRLSPDAVPAEREKAKQKLAAIRAELLVGSATFAERAKERSQCPSAPQGGDIGIVHRKFQNVDEAFAKAAFALKVNELSLPVETEFGVHLIKVTERQEGKPAELEKSLEDIRDCYAEDLRTALLNQLRKKAKVEITLP